MIDPAAARQVARTAQQLRTTLKATKPREEELRWVGILLAFAYPDRIAQRRSQQNGRFLLSGGKGATVHLSEPLAVHDYLVVARLDSGQREARMQLAAVIESAALYRHFPEMIVTTSEVSWNQDQHNVMARTQQRLGALVLHEEPQQRPPAEQVLQVLLRGIGQNSLALLPWSEATRQWQARVTLLRGLLIAQQLKGVEESAWPEVSDVALQATLETWLSPYLMGIARREQLQQIDLQGILNSLLNWNQQQLVDQLVPTHITVPSGSRIAIDYLAEDGPVLAVRLQELFGCAQTPAIAQGTVPLKLYLLSPARRPIQITRDLGGFWAGAYAEVKKELKGRYPKHLWPDDPLQAQPTTRLKPRH